MQTLLAYINGDREYVLFDPNDKESCERSMNRQEDLAAFEETGRLTLLLYLLGLFGLSTACIWKKS